MQSSTFTVTVNDGTGTGDSAAAMSTVNVEVPTGPNGWDIWTGAGGNSSWGNGENWSLGQPPGSEDVAYIDAVNASPGITTISDDLAGTSQTVAQLIIRGGTTLDISDSPNSGISFEVAGNVGGGFKSAMYNAGTIDVQNVTLDVVGDTTNSGTIQADGLDGIVTFGAVDVQNAGGTILALGEGAVDLNGTYVQNGTLSLSSGSSVDIETDVDGTGIPVVLDDVTVIGVNQNKSPASTIEVGISTSATLMLQDGTSITHGTLQIESGGTVDIEHVQNTGLNDATLDDVSVVGEDSSSTIEVGVSSTATLTLDDGTVIAGAALTVGGDGTLHIEGSATLDGVTVDNSGTIQVDQAQGPTPTTLTLDDGTSISGGALNVGSVGTLLIAAGSDDIGATLDGVNVTNYGTIQIGSSGGGAQDPTLILDNGTSITGGALTIESGNTLTLEGASITNTAITFAGTGDTLNIDAIRALTAPAPSPALPPAMRSISLRPPASVSATTTAS